MWLGGEELVPDTVGDEAHRNVPERLKKKSAALCLWYRERLDRNGASASLRRSMSEACSTPCARQSKACTFTPTSPRTTLDVDRQDAPSLAVEAGQLVQAGAV
jgi:hypothetical protein